MVWDLCCFQDLGEKDRQLDQLIGDKGVCRTAPATLGLLKRTQGIILSTCSKFSSGVSFKFTKNNPDIF